jgi:hypothetical protein
MAKKWRRAIQKYGSLRAILFEKAFKTIIIHYCLVSLMWMKIGSNDITEQVPGVS